MSTPDSAGRAIARRLYPDEPCEVCGGRGERHHKDSNRLNNSRSNIAFLCKRHHNAAHRLSDGRIGGGPRPRVNAMRTSRAIAMTVATRELMAVGLSADDVAVVLRVHPFTVYRWLRKYPV